MTTRIVSGGPATGVRASDSAVRVTAPPARPFKAMMTASAAAILDGAESAVQRLPGGPILAAALRSTPESASSPAAPSAVGPSGTLASNGAGASGGAPQNGIEGALSETANQNLYFLEIQERMSAENRTFTTVSNVLKARHDTVKNAIGNIR